MSKFVRSTILLLVVLNLSYFGFNSVAKTQIQNGSANILPDNGDTNLNKETNRLNIIDENNYEGCWSSSTGQVLSIDNNRIKRLNNLSKPMSVYYQKLDIPLDYSGVLLQLINRPQFYGLGDFIFIEGLTREYNHTEMRIKFYESYEDFLSEKPSGHSGIWVKEVNCDRYIEHK